MSIPLKHTPLPRRLSAERLVGEAALREAQALRYEVFSDEFGAQFNCPANPQSDARSDGGAPRLDADAFDPHCQHIGVRDLSSGRLVATTRLMDHEMATKLGRFYSEGEFSIQGLAELQGPLLELGRTCVDPQYRNGATIGVLWGELAEILNEGGYRYLMGCASISMRDGGVQAQAIVRRLRRENLCTEQLRVVPRTPLPGLDLPEQVTAQLPPLLKGYLRAGAKICGEPCWDPDFRTADIFVLLNRDELCPRYAKHFKAAV